MPLRRSARLRPALLRSEVGVTHKLFRPAPFPPRSSSSSSSSSSAVQCSSASAHPGCALLTGYMESEEGAGRKPEGVANPTEEPQKTQNCKVVLNRLKFEEEEEQEEEETDDGEQRGRDRKGDKEELRRGGKVPTSRIPTFQSSASRKRLPGQGVEPVPLLVRDDPSGVVSQGRIGETPRTRVSAAKETGLPLPSTRLPLGNVEHMLHFDAEAVPPSQIGEQALPSISPMTLSPRPSIRAESVICPPELSPIIAQEVPTEAWSSDPQPCKFGDVREEQQEEESEVPTDVTNGSSVVDEEEEQSDTQVTEQIEGHRSQDTGEIASFIYRSPESLPGEAAQIPSKGMPGESEEGDPHQEVTGVRRRNAPLRQSGEARDQQTGQRKSAPSSASRKCFPGSPLSCLFLCSLLLLGGFTLHAWRYGTSAAQYQLLEQLNLHWLERLWMLQEPCSSECRFILVESIPQGPTYDPGMPILPPTSQAWLKLLGQANSTVSIAGFYFTLRASDLGLEEPSAQEGEEVFKQLTELGSRGVKLQIAVNSPETYPQDTSDLNKTGAEVRQINLKALTNGVLHTKLWVVDGEHFYLGSANTDWRSLTQVKEMGVRVENCSCLAQDAGRIFGIYWYIGSQPLPPFWPKQYSALSSAQYPLLVKINGVPAHVYLSSSPPLLSAYGRTDDLAAILSVIADAQMFIFISVMDYLPFTEFSLPKRFWPAIDSALRDAACSRHVEVNLLVSCWPHSSGAMFVFLESLAVLRRAPVHCNIKVKVYTVSSTAKQKTIPFARVNHAKFMVTDRVVYIGTSNWSEDYFTNTAGVGLVVNQTGFATGPGQQTVQSQLKEIFERDWKSENAEELSHKHVEQCQLQLQ